LQIGWRVKRYNTIDKNNWILGVLVPILLFLVSMNGTYAYYTATTTPHSSETSTAILSIKLANEQVQVNSVAYGSQLLVPGDTLAFTGSLKNESSLSVYAVMVLKTVITKSNSESDTLTKYFSRDNANWVEIKIENEAFNGDAFEMAKNATLSFDFEQVLNGADFNNDYFGAEVVVSVSAYSIQTANLTLVQANKNLYERVTA